MRRRPGPVLCFGEILWRVDPGDAQGLLETPSLLAYAGGAEANVAVTLALLGHRSRMLGMLPANRLGDAAIDQLRRHGVDTSHLRQVPGRMGLYFHQPGGSGRRARIIYDRAGSAFALRAPAPAEIRTALDDCAWAHLSGITPALGPHAEAGFRRMLLEVRRRRLGLSFDCNIRPTLWDGRWAEARKALRAGLSAARLAIADPRSLALALGLPATGLDEPAQFAALCRQAFDAFPRNSGNRAYRATRAQRHAARNARGPCDAQAPAGQPSRIVDPVIDRIGTGDAFAGALLAALLEGQGEPAALDFALGACCLKHTVPGDFNLVARDQIDEFCRGETQGIRR